MKITYLIILTISFLTFSAFAYSANNDSQFNKNIVGTWICMPNDSECTPGTSTYNADGTLNFVAYKTNKCLVKETTAEALWRIEDGHLIIIVQSSEGKFPFPPGLISDDKIISIGNNKMVLIASDGDKLVRLKSNTCISGTEI